MPEGETVYGTTMAMRDSPHIAVCQALPGYLDDETKRLTLGVVQTMFITQARDVQEAIRKINEI